MFTTPLTRLKQISTVLQLHSFNTGTSEGRSQERHRRVVLTAVSSVVAKVIAVLTSIISVPLTLEYLGAERFGMWMTMSSVIAMLSFADFGIGNGLLNSVAHANGRDDYKSMQEYVSSGFVILTSIAMIIFGIFIIVYPLISWNRVFNVQSELAIQEVSYAIIVFVSCFVLNIPLGIVQKVQLGLQSGFIANLWQGLGSLTALTGIIVVIHFQGGLPWLVLAVTGTPLVIASLNGIVFFKQVKPELKPRLKNVSSVAMKKIASTGLLFLVLQIVVAVAYASDNIVIAQILGAEAVTQYAVPEKMFSISMMFIIMILAPLWPAYGEAIARGDIPWVKRTLKRSLIIALSFSGGISLMLVLFGEKILSLWVGHNVTPPLLLLLGLGVWKVIEAGGNALAAFLNGANVVRLQVIIATLTAISAIILKIFLVQKIGVAGVVWATAVSYLCFAAVPYFFLTSGILHKTEQKLIDIKVK